MAVGTAIIPAWGRADQEASPPTGGVLSQMQPAELTLNLYGPNQGRKVPGL